MGLYSFLTEGEYMSGLIGRPRIINNHRRIKEVEDRVRKIKRIEKCLEKIQKNIM